MATLTVTTTTDFRSTALTNIDSIVFNTSASATATFGPDQFGAGLISNTVAIHGDSNFNRIQIISSAQATFSAAGWTFDNWATTDKIFFRGSSVADSITGSSQSDEILGNGGADTIDAGGGDDAINIVNPALELAAGTSVAGGSGFDRLDFIGNAPTYDARPVAIASIEQARLSNNNQTVIFGDDQIGAGAITQVVGIAADTQSLVVRGNHVDLSGVGFLNWVGAQHTITIAGTSGLLDTLIGSSQAETIGGLGNSIDIIAGRGGADILNGGGGNDTFRYVAASDVVAGETVDGGAGTDTLATANAGAIDFGVATLTSIEKLAFQSGNSTATFKAAQIGPGTITAVSGGAGIDALVVEGSVVDLSGVAFSSWTNGTDSVTLDGTAVADFLTGATQDDTLNGGAGADAMKGLLGNDTYIVDDAGDRVFEGTGRGTDRVATSVSYTLEAGQSVETLTPISFNTTTNIDLTGNALAQSITGNAGNNTISDGGAGGIDTMAGLGGNDTYIVNNAGDVVNEAAGAGTDHVATSVSYTLRAGQSIETFTPISFGTTTNIDLTGNALAQAITGNAGDNVISDGGAGAADTMGGLGGNDTYIVNNAGDVVNEAAAAGTDHVATSVSYTLAANQSVETFTPVSFNTTTNIDLIGNALVQAITGNAGDNVIDGKGGNDTLTGKGGNDTFRFDTALNAATNDPTVTDFSVAADIIELSHAIFTVLPTGALSADAFFIGAAANDASDRVIYNSGTGALSFDADGNGGGASVQFAKLSGGLTTLSASQFQVIA